MSSETETDTDPDTLLALLPPAGGSGEGVAKPILNAAPLAGGARTEPKDINQLFRGASPAAAVPPNPKTFVVSGSCYFCQQAVESTEAAILMPCNHAVHLRCGVPPLVAGKWRCFVCQKNAAPIAFSKDIVSIGINGAQLSLLTEKMYAEYQQNTVSRERQSCARFLSNLLYAVSEGHAETVWARDDAHAVRQDDYRMSGRRILSA